MGKKAKLGKRRRDKFYHLAKETGYRARSAFKLIQLNRKFNFLQQSRVLIDLCAAPGGWLQVASNHMPVSSVIIGVDLVKIKPIHNVISIQADITTPQCRQLLQKELKTWKADCVLNDGSPNVGSSWLQDAFTQSELTLSALKLATEFLRPGGTFITKVFRSRDYQQLLQTFQQLFNKVHATKPQASRNESAEIFVVCQEYKLSKKPDPKLLDPKYVFQEQNESEKQPVSLQNIQKPPKAAEGYADGQHMLFKSSSVLDFISCDDHLTMLANTHQLVFDKASEVFAKHPDTNSEIIEYCKDIKVLGLRELKLLIKWRGKMRSFIDSVDDEDNNMEHQSTAEGDDGAELDELDKKVEEMMKEEQSEMKSAIKRKRKMLKKAAERALAQKETHREVAELIADKAKTFSLKSIKSRQQLNELEGGVVYSDSEPEDIPPPLLIDPLERERSEGEEQEEEPLEWETYEGTAQSERDEQDDNDDDEPAAKKVRKLDPEGLAIGAVLVASKKKRSELIDSGYNKWSNNDGDNLPDWFVEDESKHCRKQLPITREMVEEYKKKLKEINARPIKKIAEAKARKKQRSLKKLEGVRKRAQVICDNADVTDHEKAHTIRNMYKKAGFLGQKKEEVKYVVAKKGMGKRVHRPKGVSGRFKVVDPRMKKDKRLNKKSTKGRH